MSRTRARVVGAALGLVLVLGASGCTDRSEDADGPGDAPPPGAPDAPALRKADAADPVAFATDGTGARNCVVLDDDRATLYARARLGVAQPVVLGEMRPTGVGALPAAASLTLTTYVAADPGSDAPDYALSEDGVPGTLVEEATGGRPIGEEVDEEGRDCSGASVERAPRVARCRARARHPLRVPRHRRRRRFPSGPARAHLAPARPGPGGSGAAALRTVRPQPVRRLTGS